MEYVFDTSSVRVLGNYYPDRFPTFWQRFDEAVDTGAVVSVREVYNELENQLTKEWFVKWIKQHRGMFVIPGAEETEFLRTIFEVRHFQALVGETQRLKGQPVADPFVIACAYVRNGTVVTEEERKPNAAKIPNVCDYFQIPCTNVEGFLSEKGWQF
jgi:hypothetical protein